MILTGDEILSMWQEGRLTIDPFNVQHIGANSYDLTLGDEILTYDEALLSMKKENRVTSHHIKDTGFILYPGQLYLGHTVEHCGSSEFVTCLEGRSSIGRLGIQIHLTAGFGDLGFDDTWTLELSVVKPVEIFAGVRIAQAIFYEARGICSRPYQGKYSGQRGPRPSMMWRDSLVRDDTKL